jgi:hypothetical protein
VTISDWKLNEIKRGEEGNIDTFIALYSSDDARLHFWEPEAEIAVDIFPTAEDEELTYHFNYVTEGTKREWYDYLK